MLATVARPRARACSSCWPYLRLNHIQVQALARTRLSDHSTAVRPLGVLGFVVLLSSPAPSSSSSQAWFPRAGEACL